MTFYESALRVLEEAGKPLTHIEITQASMDKGLLSHVGKMPEMTMLARLAAMAKRPRDRKLAVTAKDTFALTDWMLPEDAAALAATGVPEAHPEEGLPPLRPIERHPEPNAQNARGVGRGGERERKRRDRGEDDGRRRRFPPLSEVAFEVLDQNGGLLTSAEILEKARARELCGPDLGAEALLYALVEDNQRRIDAGRKPQFHLRTAEGATEPSITLDPNSDVPAGEVQAALCKAANVPCENGRAILRSREEPRPAAAGVSADDLQLFDQARQAVKEARRAQARIFRRRLAELELGSLEKAVVKLLHQNGFREVRVARRSREGLIFTTRRRDGSLELRQAVRLLRGNVTVERRHVQELRRDLNQVGAQVGLLCCAGDVRGDARSEATASGQLVQIWGGDALAEKFFDAEVGVVPRRLALFDIDESFFAQAGKDADEARARREERQRERLEEGDAPPNGEAVAAAPTAPGPDEGDADGDDGDDGDEEGGPGEPAEAGGAINPDGSPQGTGRRRRRRRRRRGGRGGRPEGAPGAPGAPAASGAFAGGPVDAGGPVAASAPQAPAPAPAPAPASGGGDNSGV